MGHAFEARLLTVRGFSLIGEGGELLLFCKYGSKNPLIAFLKVLRKLNKLSR